MIKNEISPVWFIENNSVKKANKVVTKIKYNDVEIPVLKSQLDGNMQDYLYKDSNNEYWSMGLLSIKAKLFTKQSEEDALGSVSYCNMILNHLKELDLNKFFEKKIENKQYFNTCELKYISKYYPDIYDKALQCREKHIENRNLERERERIAREESNKNKVENVNNTFNQKIDNMKSTIRLGGKVDSENLEFYKDNNYDNGITKQNNFLYLAKEYGIKIPLATQGFINNKLVKYDFGTNSYSYIKTQNGKPSSVIYEYMDIIQKCIKEEFEMSVVTLKDKAKKIKEKER